MDSKSRMSSSLRTPSQRSSAWASSLISSPATPRPTKSRSFKTLNRSSLARGPKLRRQSASWLSRRVTLSSSTPCLSRRLTLSSKRIWVSNWPNQTPCRSRLRCLNNLSRRSNSWSRRRLRSLSSREETKAPSSRMGYQSLPIIMGLIFKLTLLPAQFKSLLHMKGRDLITFSQLTQTPKVYNNPSKILTKERAENLKKISMRYSRGFKALQWIGMSYKTKANLNQLQAYTRKELVMHLLLSHKSMRWTDLSLMDLSIKVSFLPSKIRENKILEMKEKSLSSVQPDLTLLSRPEDLRIKIQTSSLKKELAFKEWTFTLSMEAKKGKTSQDQTSIKDTNPKFPKMKTQVTRRQFNITPINRLWASITMAIPEGKKETSTGHQTGSFITQTKPLSRRLLVRNLPRGLHSSRSKIKYPSSNNSQLSVHQLSVM